MNNLFNLLKTHKYSEFIDSINLYHNDDNFDINLRDVNDNYYITYAILFNNIDIVKILIKHNCRIDCFDKFNKPLILLPILYNYEDILKLLLDYDKKSIGLSIINIIDNQMKIPLMYAIENKNISIIKLLLSYNANPNLSDDNNFNSLFYAIKSKNIEIINLIINKINNINEINKNGDTYLNYAINQNFNDCIDLLIKHNININIQNYVNEYAAIHICILNNNLEILQLLLNDKNININLQTNIGNTPLHLAIFNNNSKIINLLINQPNINFNLWNINSEIPLHILLKNKHTITDNILLSSSFLIKDNSGYTCLYYLIKNYDWMKYKHILIKKQLNPFANNIFDLIDSNNKKEFMDIIYESYFYNLKLHKNNWLNKWENLCSVETNISNKCLLEIKNHIKKTEITYPINVDINIKNSENNCSTCSYIGDNLDLIIGLLNLKKKYNIEFFYNNNLKYDMFEIIWINNELKIPKNLNNAFKTINKRYLVILIGIILPQCNHTNILLYDNKNKNIERFEPHGSTFPINYNYYPDILDEKLNLLFLSINESIHYISPKSYLPKIGFQWFDSCDIKCKNINDPGGFCGVWCIWYVEQRLKYNISRNKLVDMLILYIKTNNYSFKNIIRNYSNEITHIRDIILKKSNLDINKWSNENYTNEEYNNLINVIYRYFS